MAKRTMEQAISTKDRIFGSVLVLVVALAVRLIYLNAAATMPTFGFLTFDLLHFHNIAVAIFQDNQIGHEAVFKAPLYSLVLSQIYGIASNPIYRALMLQCIVGSLSAVLVFLIAAHYYSRRISITAGLVAALYGTLIYFDTELLAVSLTVFLILAAVYLLLLYGQNDGMALAAGAGVALALAGAATPETLILVPVAGWWIYRGRAGKKQSRVGHCLIMLAVTVLVTVPFAVRNNSLGGEKIPYVTDLGVRLAIANQTGADGRTFVLPNGNRDSGQNYANALEATDRTRGRELPVTEMGGFWLKEAIGFIVGQPLQWVKLELRKLACFISGYEISTDRPMYYIAGEGMPLMILLFDKFISFPFGLILPLALLMPLTVRNPRQKHNLLMWSTVALFLVSMLFNAFAYQRALIVPFVIVWAAAGFWGLVALYQKQEFRRFYTWLPVLIAAIVVVNGIARIPGLVPTIDSEFEGKMYVANALLTANRLDDAKDNYEAAMRRDPRSPRPYSSLANIYSQKGNDSLATVYYNRAMAVDPSDDRPMRGIASILKRRQKLGELNNLLYGVMRDFPKANWAYQEYAALHIRLGEFTQAADIYERSFAADSTDFESIFRKGEVYLTADMRQEAEAEFKRYLQYAPNSVPARANLGQVYARQQRVDEARREFGYVREQQPGNPASYFNLASLYYQSNDLARATSYLDTVAALDHTFPGYEEMRKMIDSARVNK